MNSDHVREGVQQAPHRSLFNALGYTKEEMKKPMIGVVCSYNEIVPGHINVDKICGISGDCGLRRDCHGTCGHEVFSCDKRSDCGFHGMYGEGTSV